jgi:hypothetical protein
MIGQYEDAPIADAGAGERWLTRNRFLKAVGGGVFGAATSMVIRQEPAFAQHLPTPSPCVGYPECHYCEANGSYCTSYCWWPHSIPVQNHCHTELQYWETCTTNGNWYRCRDWHEQFPGYSEHHCLCRHSLGRC